MHISPAIPRGALGREPRSYDDLCARARRYALERLAGRTVINNATQLAITFAPDDLKNATRHGTPAHLLQLVDALPSMMSRARYFSRLEDLLHRPDIRWLYVFTASADIGDQLADTVLVVRQTLRGQCFFDRMLDGQPAAAPRRRADGGALPDGATAGDSVPPPLNIFVGGADDDSSGIVKGYYNQFKEDHARQDSHYFNWQDMDGILNAVRSAALGQRVNVIAHSYGAHTVGLGLGMMAPTGIHVDRLITIDPVGRSLVPDTLHNAVGTWVNVSSDPSDTNRSDVVAILGGRGGHLPSGSADANYSVTTHHRDFKAMMTTPGPSGLSAEQFLLGTDLPESPRPGFGETFGGV